MSLIKRRNPPAPVEDFGFGKKIARNTSRMIRSDGSFQVERVGNRWQSFNLYHWLVSLKWSHFWFVVLCFYIGVNVLFTTCYVLIGDENLTGNPAQFSILPHVSHAFFFSIQTFTTVGYGGVVPVGFLTNMVAGIEALAGILAAALMSGLFFSRFSRAKSSIAFSQNAVIAPYEDATAVMFRLANSRNTNLSDVRAQVIISYIDKVSEEGVEKGVEKRAYDPFALERSSIQMFPLNWTIVHKIDEKSPLFGKKVADLEVMDVEILISISAYDDTFAQTVHTRHSYKWHEIRCGYKFAPMYSTNEAGVVILELDKINSMTAVETVQLRA